MESTRAILRKRRAPQALLPGLLDDPCGEQAGESELLPNRRKVQIAELSVDIRQRHPLPAELSFMAKHLVQVTLPHRDPGDVPVWTRTNGDLTLVIARTGIEGEGKVIGYPYGTIPRLLLYWITREAVRTQSRYIELGKNFSDFMREVGLNPASGGGKRSDTKRLKEQMVRLFAASISFHQTRTSGSVVGQRTLGMLIAPRRELWWDPRNIEQTGLWQSWIELGEDFFNAITSAPVPVDTRALRVLKNSPLALDLYGWATYKTYTAARTGQAQVVSYQALMAQLGADYADRKNFKKKLLSVLKEVQVVFPQLRLEQVPGGIKILPSHPAVPVGFANLPAVKADE